MMKTYTMHCFPHEGGRCSFQRNYRGDRAARAWAEEALATGQFKWINLLRGRAKIGQWGPVAPPNPVDIDPRAEESLPEYDDRAD